MTSKADVAAAPHAPPQSRRDVRFSRLFLHFGFITCICLQRFGITIGGSAFSFVLPLFALLLVWAMLRGAATIDAGALRGYAVLVAVTLFGTLLAQLYPDPRFGFSAASLFMLLSTYTILLVRPTTRFDRSAALDIFLFYCRLCAVLGIVQYGAQFAGVRFYAFGTLIPALKPLLIESFYNTEAILAYGSSTIRSNGFFLLEPSLFSQLMAVAILIETMIYRRRLYLPLYGLAYLFSYSGTGLLILAVTLALYGMLYPRRVGRIAGFGIAAGLFVVAMSFAFPNEFAVLSGRSTEIGSTGSSGFARYMGQFQMFDAYKGEGRLLMGYGPGATERSDHYFPGSNNPFLKLTIDYGVAGLIAFYLFFILSIWRRDIPLLSLAGITLFQLGGGSLLFMPIIAQIVLLCRWTGPGVVAKGRALVPVRRPRATART